MKVSTFVPSACLALIAALLVPISLESCEQRRAHQQTQLRVEAAVLAGNQAYAAKRFEIAQASFARALLDDPSSSTAQLGLNQAQAQLILNRQLKLSVDNAIVYIERFEATQESTKPQPEIELALGQLYHAVGDTERAKASFTKILKDGKGYPRGHYAHGLFLMDSGDLKSARRAFEDALSAQPNFLSASLALSGLYRKAQRAHDAKKVLETQIRFSESSAPLLYELGDTLLELKEHEGAYQRLKQALQAKSSSALKTQILGRLGIASFLTKRGYEAVGYFERMPTNSLTPLMRSNLALAYQNLEKHERALQLLEPLHAANPLDAGLLVQLMTSLIKAKKGHRARKLGTSFLMSAQRIKALAGSAETVRKLMAQIPMKPPKPSNTSALPSGKGQ